MTRKLFFLLLFTSLLNFAQNNDQQIDSLYHKIKQLDDSPLKVVRLIKLDSLSHYKRPDFIEEALDIATNIYDTKGIAKAYHAKGYSEKVHNRFLKSVEYYKHALNFLENSHDILFKIKLLNHLGVSLRKISDDKDAYKYYMQALDLAKNIHDNKLIARIYNGIGNVFVNTEEYQKALYYFKKSLDLEFKNKNLQGEEYNFANIGEVFVKLKKYDSAEYYLKKSLDLAKVIYKPRLPGLEYNLLAYLYKDKGDYLKAIYYYDLAIPILEDQNIQRYVANSYINRGISKIHYKKFKQAYQDINIGLNIARHIHSKENISLGYDALVVYYKTKKDYQNALSAHIMAKKFHDSIVNVTAKNNIISAQILYETKEKDKQIKELAYEKELQKKQSRRNFLLFIGVLIGSALVILFLYMFFSLRRRNKDLELEQKNSQLQSYLLKINDLEGKMKKQGQPKIDLDAKLKKMDLTKREIDVLKLISKGFSNEEIADKMFISKNTVKSHIKNIYLKLDVKNRIQVVRKIQEDLI